MDFWEGALIGPVWVQTDYQDRKHRGFYFALGVVCILFLLAYVFFDRLAFFLPLPNFVYLLIAIFLTLALPFAGARYRAMSLPVKVLVLFAYAFQYIAAWSFVVKLTSQYVTLEIMDLFMAFGNMANSIMVTASGLFSFLGGIASTLAGMVMGGVLMGLAGILAFILSIYIPLIVFFILKRLQRLVDALVLKTFFSERLMP